MISDLSVDDESRLELALAIAKPGSRASQIGRNNKVIRSSLGIRRAVQERIAFFVRVDDDVLALDWDGEAELGEREVERIVADLERAGYDAVVTRSGGPARFHVFAIIDPPEILEALKKVCRGRGFDVRQAIRPPLTPHRDPARTSSLVGLTVGEALARLRQNRTPPTTISQEPPPRPRSSGVRRPRSRRPRIRHARPRTTRGTLPYRLSDRARAMIESDTYEDFGYRSRSERDQAVLVYLILAGCDFESCVEVFSWAECGDRFREDASRALPYLRRSYDNAVKHVGEPGAVRSVGPAKRSAIGSGRLAIIAGDPEATVVYAALADARDRQGCPDIEISTWRLRHDLRMAKPTFRRAVTRLAELGLVSAFESGGVLPGPTYVPSTVRVEAPVAGAETPGVVVMEGPNLKLITEHPLFHRGALGRIGALVLALRGATTGIQEMAQIIGCTPRTVRRHLQRLDEVGLPFVSAVADLDRAAQHLELVGEHPYNPWYGQELKRRGQPSCPGHGPVDPGRRVWTLRGPCARTRLRRPSRTQPCNHAAPVEASPLVAHAAIQVLPVGGVCRRRGTLAHPIPMIRSTTSASTSRVVTVCAAADRGPPPAD